jgi:hypothetical protein
MNIHDAYLICYPLASPPNWPVNPPDYYDTPAELRARFIDQRTKEIADDPTDQAAALMLYLENNPYESMLAITNACGGTLVAAIALSEMMDKAIAAYIENEWEGLKL